MGILRRVLRRRHESTVVLVQWGVFPDNPWQRVVSAGAESAGIEVVTLEHGADLGPWIERAHRDRVVVHFNWTAPISQRADDAAGADASVQRVLDSLNALRRAGGRLLWTLHNERAHELVHPLAEERLLAGLARSADAIHVMHASAADLLPSDARDRVVVVPHPSYDGVYPDDGSRADARASFGIADDTVVILAFGLLRPYKVMPATVRGFLEAREGGLDAHLLIAGQPGQGFDPTWFEALEDRDDVTTHLGFVDVDDVARWHRAADVLAMPQRTGLNSGTLLLAATFGLPVVAGPSRAARSREDEGWVVVEDSTDDAWLARGIERLSTDAGAAAAAAARAVHPQHVGDLFATLVRQLAARR